MTRVVALQAWSNGSITMEEKQIADLQDALAAELIAQGIVAPTALPAITPADAGKVLTANDSGVWVAANPTSGGGVLVVGVTISGELENVYTLDKTWQEILDANYAVVIETDGLAATKTYHNIRTVSILGLVENRYAVFVEWLDNEDGFIIMKATTASGYPTYTFE